MVIKLFWYPSDTSAAPAQNFQSTSMFDHRGSYIMKLTIVKRSESDCLFDETWAEGAAGSSFIAILEEAGDMS